MDVIADEALRRLRRGRPHRAARRGGRGPRRRLLFAVVVAGCAALGAGTWWTRDWMTQSPRFRLRRAEFPPLRYAAEDDLRRALAAHFGVNLFRLDLARLARDLEGRRPVRRATVRRVLPDAVFCAVEEREPQALALLHDRVWAIDGDGVPVQPQGENGRTWALPIFTGLAEADPSRLRNQVRRGLAAMASLHAVQPSLLAEISELDLRRDDRIEMRLNDGGPIVRLHPGAPSMNLDRWLALRDYLETDFGGGAYVDLRFRDRIAFRPAPAGDVRGAAGPGGATGPGSAERGL